MRDNAAVHYVPAGHLSNSAVPQEEALAEHRLLRLFLLLTSLALGLRFVVEFAATVDPTSLLAGLAALMAAVFVLIGRRPETEDELRRNRIASVGIVLGFVALAVLLTAFPLSPRANTSVMSALLGGIVLWVLWRQLAHRRP
jgi:uncharacterized membrane protein HdeD (DUF308 family)